MRDTVYFTLPKANVRIESLFRTVNHLFRQERPYLKTIHSVKGMTLEAIDAINRKNSTSTVRVASQGDLSNFGLRTAFLSRHFTTNLNEVIEVKL